VGGGQQHIDINMGTTQVQGKFYQVNQANCPVGITRVLSTQLAVVREIVFPQTQPGEPQRRFTFTYNSDTSTTATDLAMINCPGQFQNQTRTVSHGLGELSRIATPSGSIVDYSYIYDGVHSFVLSGIGDHLAMEKITQKKITHDGTEDIWTYSIGESGGSVTAPDGSVSGERLTARGDARQENQA
jgi:hypothetical protein